MYLAVLLSHWWLKLKFQLWTKLSGKSGRLNSYVLFLFVSLTVPRPLSRNPWGIFLLKVSACTHAVVEPWQPTITKATSFCYPPGTCTLAWMHSRHAQPKGKPEQLLTKKSKNKKWKNKSKVTRPCFLLSPLHLPCIMRESRAGTWFLCRSQITKWELLFIPFRGLLCGWINIVIVNWELMEFKPW